MLGSLLIAAGEFRRASWSQVEGQAWASAVTATVTWPYPLVVALGIALLSTAWLLARPPTPTPAAGEADSVDAVRRAAVLAAVWVLPLLLLPPVLSTDAGSYADLGWMVAGGENPYTTGLGTTGSPFPYGRAWRGTTSVYPPGALQLFGWVVGATGAHWYWSVVALRLLAVAGVVGLLWAVPRLAGAVGVDPAFATWLALLNPVTLVHGVAGEHVDLLMAGLLAVALAVAERAARFRGPTPGRPVPAGTVMRGVLVGGVLVGGVLVGLAASVKQPALLAVPAVAALALPVASRTWVRLLAASAGVGASALGTFAAISAATGLGWGWIGASGNPANAAQTPTPAYLVGLLTGADVDGVTSWGQYVAVGAIAWLFVRYARSEPLRFLGLASLAWVLGFGVWREWYLIFPLAFLGLARPGRALRAAVWVGTPLWALYGTWHEYQRGMGVEASLGLAFVWSAALAFFAWTCWRLRALPPPSESSASRGSAQDGEDVLPVGAVA
nr:polyprenol phosphomannose-dependent alpha 1,6 mannosyltransferase MptB [Propioniciclava soli]